MTRKYAALPEVVGPNRAKPALASAASPAQCAIATGRAGDDHKDDRGQPGAMRDRHRTSGDDHEDGGGRPGDGHGAAPPSVSPSHPQHIRHSGQHRRKVHHAGRTAKAFAEAG
jgi:hypothetical protein